MYISTLAIARCVPTCTAMVVTFLCGVIVIITSLGCAHGQERKDGRNEKERSKLINCNARPLNERSQLLCSALAEE